MTERLSELPHARSVVATPALFSPTQVASLDPAERLAMLDRAMQSVAALTRVDEVKDLRDRAQAVAAYSRQRHDSLELVNAASELKVRAERRMGELLAGMPKQTPGDYKRLQAATAQSASVPPSLSDMGVEKTLAHRTQVMAGIPHEEFEQHIAGRKHSGQEITTSGLLVVGRQIREELRERIRGSGGAGINPKRVEKAVAVLMGETNNVHVSDENYEWYTPSQYVEAVREVMGSIDVDPASCTAANRVVQASVWYDKEDNGLVQIWAGNIFLNPPYNMPLVRDFVLKAIKSYDAGTVKQAVILVGNSTDTTYSQSLLSRFPVCFTRGRVGFWNPNLPAAVPRHGQMFVYLGDAEGSERFARVFSAFGVVMVPTPEPIGTTNAPYRMPGRSVGNAKFIIGGENGCNVLAD